MYKILFVEDSTNYVERLGGELKQNDYDVVNVDTPVEAIAEVANETYDLVVSDYILPQMDGIKMISTLKQINTSLKSMILTRYMEEKVEMEALEANIDVFLHKDKSSKLIVKYVEVLLQRERMAEKPGPHKLTSARDNLVIDLQKREVYQGGLRIPAITYKEFCIMALLMENKGVALSREEITEALWETSIETIDMRVIDGHIKRLRQKLSLLSLTSVRGYGYKWNE